jgi:hypothetical protein
VIVKLENQSESQEFLALIVKDGFPFENTEFELYWKYLEVFPYYIDINMQKKRIISYFDSSCQINDIKIGAISLKEFKEKYIGSTEELNYLYYNGEYFGRIGEIRCNHNWDRDEVVLESPIYVGDTVLVLIQLNKYLDSAVVREGVVTARGIVDLYDGDRFIPNYGVRYAIAKKSDYSLFSEGYTYPNGFYIKKGLEV